MLLIYHDLYPYGYTVYSAQNWSAKLMGYGSYTIQGKHCGYLVDATCEEDGCSEQIDRGLAYACGDNPGEFDDYCAGYFCAKHLYYSTGGRAEWQGQRCDRCAKAIEKVA